MCSLGVGGNFVWRKNEYYLIFAARKIWKLLEVMQVKVPGSISYPSF
jgi:hypothetical protein